MSPEDLDPEDLDPEDLDPEDLDPEDLAEALDGLEAQARPAEARGSGVGVAQGRSFGAESGRVHGDPSDPLLVGGVGYPYLGDLAVGTVVAHRLAADEPEGVAVADLSHTPVASVQTVAEGAHEAVLLVGAEKRGGSLNDGEPSEDPGRVRFYAADDFPALDHEEAVELVGQGAMGLITVENVVQVGRALGELPERTHAVTVEPAYDSWGMEVEEFSEPVGEVLEEVLERVGDWIEEERPG